MGLMKQVSILVTTLCTAQSASEQHKFYDHDDYKATDYNMFDSFEGYTWHKYEHTKKQGLKQFYLQKQADKEFNELLNISFDVDLIYINDIIKPKYEDDMIYPTQNDSRSEKTVEGQSLDASGQKKKFGTFNKEMNIVVANAFRQGYSTRTFTGMDMFRYRDDNVQVRLRLLEHSQLTHGVEFKLKFQVNKVEFNSRLNEEIMHRMESPSNVQDCASAIAKDHEVSKRQFSYYLVDCRPESSLREMCNQRQDELANCQLQINEKYSNQIYMGILTEANTHILGEEALIRTIDQLISNQFYPGQSKDINRHSDESDLTDMFKDRFVTFQKYLSDDLAPKVSMLHQTFYRYKFESPLDFIMIKSDFKRFYESFTQARLSMLYSLHIHKDSLFQLDSLRQDYQLQMSEILYKNFESQVVEMDAILAEYHHILEHDNMDCSTHVSGESFLFRCWFKRYGCPMLCMTVFILASILWIKWTLTRKVVHRNID